MAALSYIHIAAGSCNSVVYIYKAINAPTPFKGYNTPKGTLTHTIHGTAIVS